MLQLEQVGGAKEGWMGLAYWPGRALKLKH